MPVITIRIMGGTDVLKTEGLVLKSMCMGHMGMGCQAELPIISICMMWMEKGETMCIIWPRSHKASKAKGLRGNMWKDVKGVGWNDIREFRDNGRGRWRHIPSIGGRVTVRRGRRKSRGRLRM
jgi:hypothetical protein